jgi:ribosome maturation factor RimP
MKRDKRLENIEKVVVPALADLGFELVDRSIVSEEGRCTLRLKIDHDPAQGKTGGITHAECVQASRAVEYLLDVEGAVPMAYDLEVSSPGLDRPLRRTEDFLRFVGHEIEVRTVEPLEGRRHYRGRLEGIVNDLVGMTVDGQRFDLPMVAIAKAYICPPPADASRPPRQRKQKRRRKKGQHRGNSKST